jgi:hypothetical protein
MARMPLLVLLPPAAIRSHLLLRIRPGMERDARLVGLTRVGDAVRLS